VLGQSSGTNQVSITNKAGETVFGINQHFYVPDPNTGAQPLMQPPTFVSFKPQGKGQATQQGGTGSGTEQSAGGSGAQGESRPQAVSGLLVPTVTNLTETQIPFQQTENISPTGGSSVLPLGTIGFIGAGGDGGGAGGGLTMSSNIVTTSSAPIVVTGFNNIYDIVDGQFVTGKIGSLPAQQTGCISSTLPGCFTPPSSEPTLNAFWGRWQDGTITDNGVVKSFQMGVGNSPGLHYLGGFDITPFSVIAGKTGTAFFNSTLGTSPTNSLGQVGSGGPTGMQVTFGASPKISIEPWSMSFSGRSYSFPVLQIGVQSLQNGTLAGFQYKGTQGTCTGSCNPNNLLEVVGGFAGKSGQHAGMAIGTENNGVWTSQVRLFYCQSGSC